MSDDSMPEISDGVDETIDDDMAELQAKYNSLAATLLHQPDNEIREALTRFWTDNLDEIDEEISDWIEDDTASLANGELVTLDIHRLD